MGILFNQFPKNDKNGNKFFNQFPVWEYEIQSILSPSVHWTEHWKFRNAYDTLQNQTIKMVPTCPLNSSSHNLHYNIIVFRAPFSPMAYGHFDILQYMVSIDKIGYICIRNSKMTRFWLKMRPTKSTVIKRHDLRGVVLFFLVHFWDEYLTSLIHSFRKYIALFCRKCFYLISAMIL